MALGRFSDTTHLSESCFHMIIQKALFSTIVQGVLMYGKRRTTVRMKREQKRAQSEEAVTENDSQIYGDGQNAFSCILKRDGCFLNRLFLDFEFHS